MGAPRGRETPAAMDKPGAGLTFFAWTLRSAPPPSWWRAIRS
jgi:hypothetical protein